MEDKKIVKAYALEQLREYLIINDVEISCKDDIKKAYLNMKKQGYFFKANTKELMDDVRVTISQLAEAYDKDKDILEKDLIFFGARRVLEKMDTNKKTKC